MENTHIKQSSYTIMYFSRLKENVQYNIKLNTINTTYNPNPPWSERSDDAVGTEAVQALLGGHGVLQHVQADGTHELTVQAARGHGDLQTIRDGLLEGHNTREATLRV